MAGIAPVEARSLSSITAIGANPPSYPRNPAQARLDRVELYIVRVPGSKDVVLTPLKPPTKSNISIEAINSSLYYLHVATEDDAAVLRSIELEKENQVHGAPSQHGHSASGLPSETVSRLNSFHRKPVGGQEAPIDPCHPPPPPPHRDGLSKSLGSNNATTAHDARTQTTHSPRDPFTIPRRPVVPSGTSPTGAPTANNTVSNTSHIDQRLSYDGQRPSLENPLPQQQKPLPSETKPTQAVTDQSPVSPFHITVIRRDTASGNQWNVGTISSSSADKGVIHIEITNPGYGKFIDSAPLSTSSVGQSAAEVLKIAQNFVRDDGIGKRVFKRDVLPVKHNNHQHHSLSDVLHRRAGSIDTSKFAHAVSAKINRGYYSFQSPWNGTCSFVASISGGSIKCKHMIPSPAMSAELDGRGHNEEVTVSELRYNVPFPLEQTFRHASMMNLDGSSTSPRGKGKGKRAALNQLITSNIEKVHQRAGTYSQSEERSTSPAVPADDEDRLDLSLAREVGGGGMDRKSTKLGKLIIEDEGIKMIDLVVAASMGVWWRSSYQLPGSARN